MSRLAPALDQELEVTVRLAREAGAAAMTFYGSARVTVKEGGSPVTEADHAANSVIVHGLRAAFPGDAILSEESRDDRSRLDARRVWIVDPLDGTKEFLSENGEFSIMIGLVADGEPVLGVVYLPDGDVLYRAAAGQGSWVERGSALERLEREAPGERALRMVGSRSHADPLIEAMREGLGITDVRPSGSVGIKCSLIAAGERDVYVHPVPYLKEWDTCAPEVVLREAGGNVTDCRGGPLAYNKRDPLQPHGILATAPGTHDRVLRVVRPLYEDSL